MTEPKRTPNIDHLIRARFVEMGFSDEFIEEIEVFTKAEAERIRAARHDDSLRCEECGQVYETEAGAMTHDCDQRDNDQTTPL